MRRKIWMGGGEGIDLAGYSQRGNATAPSIRLGARSLGVWCKKMQMIDALSNNLYHEINKLILLLFSYNLMHKMCKVLDSREFSFRKLRIMSFLWGISIASIFFSCNNSISGSRWVTSKLSKDVSLNKKDELGIRLDSTKVHPYLNQISAFKNYRKLVESDIRQQMNFQDFISEKSSLFYTNKNAILLLADNNNSATIDLENRVITFYYPNDTIEIEIKENKLYADDIYSLSAVLNSKTKDIVLYHRERNELAIFYDGDFKVIDKLEGVIPTSSSILNMDDHVIFSDNYSQESKNLYIYSKESQKVETLEYFSDRITMLNNDVDKRFFTVNLGCEIKLYSNELNLVSSFATGCYSLAGFRGISSAIQDSVGTILIPSIKDLLIYDFAKKKYSIITVDGFEISDGILLDEDTVVFGVWKSYSYEEQKEMTIKKDLKESYIIQYSIKDNKYTLLMEDCGISLFGYFDGKSLKCELQNDNFLRDQIQFTID
ncbi:hypothetical protein QWY85_15710 [Neolewinella lacunae]|uniref:Uncharacterized protein n=1 Tax=Neolewinella lacunae TaxID=1517758 RepID=A0A923PQK9_9BACT|nr:hypothetical protein [Neolewinella lacunae]MBC6994942.1 hypothetical protein [Neolewinella lacunae]MDN3636114.1 hypothetical protein [Neolewinella lacunae]